MLRTRLLHVLTTLERPFCTVGIIIAVHIRILSFAVATWKSAFLLKKACFSATPYSRQFLILFLFSNTFAYLSF